MIASHVRLLVAELRPGHASDDAAIAAAARVLDQPVTSIEAALGRRVSRPEPRRATATARARRSAPGDALCPRGHRLVEPNLIRRANGTKTCRACHSMAVARHDAKRSRCRCTGTSHPCKARVIA